MHDPELGPWLSEEQHALEDRWVDLMDANAEIQAYAEMTNDEEAWKDLDAIAEELSALELEMERANMIRMRG